MNDLQEQILAMISELSENSGRDVSIDTLFRALDHLQVHRIQFDQALIALDQPLNAIGRTDTKVNLLPDFMPIALGLSEEFGGHDLPPRWDELLIDMYTRSLPLTMDSYAEIAADNLAPHYGGGSTFSVIKRRLLRAKFIQETRFPNVKLTGLGASVALALMRRRDAN